MNPADLRSMTLRDLPGPTRGLIAVFLVAIGCGYFAGLVQLHYQQAPPGSLMPGAEDAVRIYNGGNRGEPKSKFQQLIEADENLPFNGSGSMKPAFTTKSGGWATAIKDLKGEEKEKLLAEREGERLALFDWLKQGASKEAYKKDELVLSTPMVLTEEFVVDEDKSKPATKVKIKSIITERCARCHVEGGAHDDAADYPLDNWPRLQRYLKVEDSGAMDIKKLAQTTHVHLIGFTMMFFLTGLIFSFTCYPNWLKAIIAPWPMFFQVIDISCWWLGRYEPLAAQAILVTGAVVAIGFAIHILGGLLDVTGLIGRRK